MSSPPTPETNSAGCYLGPKRQVGDRVMVTGDTPYRVCGTRFGHGVPAGTVGVIVADDYDLVGSYRDGSYLVSFGGPHTARWVGSLDLEPAPTGPDLGALVLFHVNQWRDVREALDGDPLVRQIDHATAGAYDVPPGSYRILTPEAVARLGEFRPVELPEPEPEPAPEEPDIGALVTFHVDEWHNVMEALGTVDLMPRIDYAAGKAYDLPLDTRALKPEAVALLGEFRPVELVEPKPEPLRVGDRVERISESHTRRGTDYGDSECERGSVGVVVGHKRDGSIRVQWDKPISRHSPKSLLDADNLRKIADPGPCPPVDLMTIREWQVEIHQYAKDKGWWDTDRSFGEMIALCHSELSEALEEYRAGHDPDARRRVDGKPEGVPSELADVVIRILDMCEHYDIDLADVIREKHRYNLTREYRHGGKVI